MKSTIVACALALGLGLACPAQSKTIVLSPLWDSAAIASGLGACLGLEMRLAGGDESYAKPDPAGLSALDALACLPYGDGASKASTLATGAALMWPALFALSGEKGELFPAAATYAEALLWTFAAKDALKFLIPKARPYAYGSGELSAELKDEAYESFPSGHTALAFCGATSFAVLALELSPEDRATPWLVGGGYVVAAATGALRVAAGKHFIGDVAVGALLGSAIGFGVTKLHIRTRDEEAAKISVSLSAAGMGSAVRGPSIIVSYNLP
jgi:membrane-associated phospholipid phosphatase